MTEIQIDRIKKHSKVYDARNDWGDINVINLPLTASDISSGHHIEGASLQGFFQTGGLVTEHKEPERITEIYFPISGSFSVASGPNEVQLVGSFRNLKGLKEIGKLHLSDKAKPQLEVVTKDGKLKLIDGFVIPPQTSHSTSNIEKEGAITRYVSVKVRNYI